MVGTTLQRPEVLAPAGSPECLPAAVAGGADAVYLGLRHFNARGRASNFRRDDLAHYVAYCHHHGVKVYVVFNTLLHDDEHPKALDMAQAAARAGVDAAIIQDLGLWRLLTQYVPELPRHASTQMTIHSPAQVEVLADLGAERVILARELNKSELLACAKAATERGIEIEHFVHGALCYAFSGQCLMSNFSGCRSANRGTCAQNCRFVYTNDRGQTQTELSMRDFALVGRVAELADIGVASLKIEGRLKGPDYVYATSRMYRAATEAWAAGRAFNAAEAQDVLKSVFARPFTEAPLEGIYDGRSRFDPQTEAKVFDDGLLQGLDRNRGFAWIEAATAPEPGSGYAFQVDDFTGGFLVIGAAQKGDGANGRHWKVPVRVDKRGPRPPAGTPLHLNRSQQREHEAREAMAQVPVQAVSPPKPGVSLRFSLAAGEPAILQAILPGGQQIQVQSDSVAGIAEQRPVDQAAVAKAIGKLNDTPYQLEQLICDFAPQNIFFPAGQIKELRRRLCAQLPAPQLTPISYQLPAAGQVQRTRTALWVSVRSIADGQQALAAGADRVWLDGVLPPKDFQPRTNEQGKWWLRCSPVLPLSATALATGWPIVAGDVGTLQRAHMATRQVCADFYVNCYSTATLKQLEDLGAEATVVSLECSARETARLVSRRAGIDTNNALALMVHGPVPSMLTRQQHGVQPGDSMAIQASEREGGQAYRIEERARDWTVIWEQRLLCAPKEVAQTAGLVEAWVLDLSQQSADLPDLIHHYRRLADGDLAAADAIITQTTTTNEHGIFPGHLAIGSRAFDDVVSDDEV